MKTRGASAQVASQDWPVRGSLASVWHEVRRSCAVRPGPDRLAPRLPQRRPPCNSRRPMHPTLMRQRQAQGDLMPGAGRGTGTSIPDPPQSALTPLICQCPLTSIPLGDPRGMDVSANRPSPHSTYAEHGGQPWQVTYTHSDHITTGTGGPGAVQVSVRLRDGAGSWGLQTHRAVLAVNALRHMDTGSMEQGPSLGTWARQDSSHPGRATSQA